MKTAGLALCALLLVAAPAAALERVPGVLHVHSDLTTGMYSLDELAHQAEQESIGALLLAENFLIRIEYGLPPFRALTRAVHDEPSLGPDDLPRYLERVDATRRAYPSVVIVPGLEVIPHYYWTGSPFALDLRAHDTQKNVLVYGLRDPRVVAALPTTGNPGARRWGAQSVLDAVPALLIVPGVMLLTRKRRERRRLGALVVVVTHRRWLPGLVLVGLGAVALVRGWPFTVDAFPPWTDGGVAPQQALLDYVERVGGTTVWSFPEARDEGERRVGPVRVSWSTRPYGDDLLRTFRYTAFGAVYEDTTYFELPGGGWDRLLVEAAAGERSRPAWAVGEAGFHDTTAGKRLGSVQTIFLADERSERGVLDALRRGHLYALRRTSTTALVLDEFAARAGRATASSGDTLRVPPGTPLEVHVTITAPPAERLAAGTTEALPAGGAQALPLRVTVVRNGQAAEVWMGTTPFRAVYRETFDGTPGYVRLDVRGPAPHRLLTNPIFVLKP